MRRNCRTNCCLLTKVSRKYKQNSSTTDCFTEYRHELRTDSIIFHDAVRFGLINFDLLSGFKAQESHAKIKVIWQRLCVWQNEAGETLLHIACEVGNVEAVKVLLKFGLEAIAMQTLSNDDTPLHIAIANDHRNPIILRIMIGHLCLMNKTLFVDSMTAYNEYGHTVLHSAVIHNCLELMEILLRCCIAHDIDACDIKVLGSGDTILHLAVQIKQTTENILNLSSMENIILKYYLNAAEYKNNEGENAYGRTTFDNEEDYEYIMKQYPKSNIEERKNIRNILAAVLLEGSSGDIGDTYDMKDIWFSTLIGSRIYGYDGSSTNNINPFTTNDALMKAEIKTKILSYMSTSQLSVRLEVSSTQQDYFDDVQYVIWLELTTNNNASEGLQLSPRTIHGSKNDFNRLNNVEPIRIILSEGKDDNGNVDIDNVEIIDDDDVYNDDDVSQEDGRIYRKFKVKFEKYIFRNIQQSNIVVNLEEKLKTYKNVTNRLGLGELEQKMASAISENFTIGEVDFVNKEVYFAFSLFEVKRSEIIRVGTFFSKNLVQTDEDGKSYSHELFYKYRVLKAENKSFVTQTPNKSKIGYQSIMADFLSIEPFPKQKFVNDSLTTLKEELTKCMNVSLEAIWSVFCRTNANYKRELCTISTLFHDAVKVGYFHLLESAMIKIPDLSIIKEVWKRMCEWRNWHGETLLHVACETEQFEAISHLLIYDVKICSYERFVDHQCPLNIAIRRHYPLDVIESLAWNALLNEEFNLDLLVFGAIFRNNLPLAETFLKILRIYDRQPDSIQNINLSRECMPIASMEMLLYGPSTLDRLPAYGGNTKSIKCFRNFFTKNEYQMLLIEAVKNYSSLGETLLRESTTYLLSGLDKITLKEEQFSKIFYNAARNGCLLLTELLLETHKRHTHIPIDVAYLDTFSRQELQLFLQKAINDNCEYVTEVLLNICKKREIQLAVKLVDYLFYRIECEATNKQKVKCAHFEQVELIPNKIVGIIQKYYPEVCNNKSANEELPHTPLEDRFGLCVHKEVPLVVHSKLVKQNIIVEITKNDDDTTRITDKESNNEVFICKESIEKGKDQIKKHLDELKQTIEDIPEDEIQAIFDANDAYKKETNFSNNLFHDAIKVENWVSVVRCVDALLTDDLREYVKMRFGRWQNCRGETMLHVACEYGKPEAIKPLLSNFPGSIFMQTFAPGDTPLHLAIISPYYRSPLTREFIEHISKMNKEDLFKLVNLYNRQGHTVLHYAINYECLELVEIILKRCVGHSIDACAVEVLGSGDTILHLAQCSKQTSAHKSDINGIEKIILEKYPNALDYENYDSQKANEILYRNKEHLKYIEIPKYFYTLAKLFNTDLENVESIENESAQQTLKNDPKLIQVDIFLKELKRQLVCSAKCGVEQIWNLFIRLNELYQNKYNTPHILYHDAVSAGYCKHLLECLQYIVIKVIRDDIIRRLYEWRDCNGDTLSHIACKLSYGFDSMLKIWPKSCLVQSNVDLDTPLHILIRHDKGCSMEDILVFHIAEDLSHLLSLHNQEGYNVLEFAIIKGRFGFVKIFLEKCFELGIDAHAMKVEKTNETVLEMIERLETNPEEVTVNSVEYIKNTLMLLETELKNCAEVSNNDIEVNIEKLWKVVIDMNKSYQVKYNVERTLYHDAVASGLFDALKNCVESIPAEEESSKEENDESMEKQTKKVTKEEYSDEDSNEDSDEDSNEDSDEDSEEYLHEDSDEDCKKSNKECSEKEIEEYGDEIYIDNVLSRLCTLTDHRGETLLHVAIKSGSNYEEIFKIWPRAILIQSEVTLSTPLHEAIECKSKFLEFLTTEKRFLSKEVFSLLMGKYNRKGETVLHSAIIGNYQKFTTLLIVNCIKNDIQYKKIPLSGSNETIEDIIKERSKQVQEYILQCEKVRSFEESRKCKAIERREQIEKYLTDLEEKTLKCVNMEETWRMFVSINKFYQEECKTDSIIYHDVLLCGGLEYLKKRVSDCLKYSNFDEIIWERLGEWHDLNNETLIHISATQEFVTIPQLSFIRYFDFKKLLTVQNKSKLEAPFHILMRNKKSKNPDLFLCIFFNSFSKEEFSYVMRLYNQEGFTVIHCAIMQRKFNTIRLLLNEFIRHGIDPFAIKVEKSGETIEQLASYTDSNFIFNNTLLNENRVENFESMYELINSYKQFM